MSSSCPTGAVRPPTPGLLSRSSAPSRSGLLYALNREYVAPREPARRRRRARADPAVSGRRLPPHRRPDRPRGGRRRGRRRAAGAIATFVGTTRVESRGRTVTRLEYEAYEGMAEQEMARIAEELIARYDLVQGRDRASDRTGRDRRGQRRDRRLRAASRRRARRVQGRDRHPQGDRAALEEGDLRGRRGVDRPRLLTASAPCTGHERNRPPGGVGAGHASLR